jgi:hypothetical protein
MHKLQATGVRIARRSHTCIAKFHPFMSSIGGGDSVVRRLTDAAPQERVISSAIEAQRSGFDSFFVGAIPDIGYEECRTVVDMAVVAYGQASLMTAPMLGTVAGIVAAIWRPGRSSLSHTQADAANAWPVTVKGSYFAGTFTESLVHLGSHVAQHWSPGRIRSPPRVRRGYVPKARTYSCSQ